MAKKILIPVSEKYLLTVDEAAAYFNIGRDKLYEFAKEDETKFILRNGRNILFKKEAMEEYLKYAPTI